MAYDSQIATRAKENLKLNHSGPRQGMDDRLIMCHGQYSHT